MPRFTNWHLRSMTSNSPESTDRAGETRQQAADAGTSTIMVPKQKMRMSFDDMVTIKVGFEEKVFMAPRNVLCQSPFFKAALSDTWEDSKEGFTMPEDDVDAFAAYLQWAFSGQVIVCDDELTTDIAGVFYNRLVELYILADKIHDIALQNKVVDQFQAILNRVKRIPWQETTQRLFTGAPEDCMLQKLILDRLTYKLNPTGFCVDEVRANPEVYAKVLMAMATQQRMQGGLQWGLPRDRLERCYYHVHDDDNPRCQ
ncbi:hypothetical protein MBLNU457_4469t1 [Dothideomycetes sp. NU457]